MELQIMSVQRVLHSIRPVKKPSQTPLNGHFVSSATTLVTAATTKNT